MKIKDVMTRDAKMATPNDTLQQAARLMKKSDFGVLPVADGERLIGMITDRDIAVRGIAEGLGPDAKVRDAMSRDVKYCYEDEDVSHVCDNMSEIQVRRLPVMSRNKRLVGIVSLCDLMRRHPNATKALQGISKRSAQHNQSHIAA